MDAVDIAKVCVRRWYVMLPILVGAAGVSYQLAETQEITYTAAASYGLVQPSLTPEDRADQANPLGSAGDVLVGAALEAQLNSRETQAELGGGDTRGWGPGDTVNKRFYDVRIPQFETTYEVRAWGEDEQEVREVVERVIEAAPDITDALQVRAQVPPSQRYRPFVLASTQVEELPTTGWVKLVIAVMGVGLLMGAAWSVVVDRLLRWRHPKRRMGQSGAARHVPDSGALHHSTGTDAAPASRPVHGDARSDAAVANGTSSSPPISTPTSKSITQSNGQSNIKSNVQSIRGANGQAGGRGALKSTRAPGRKPSNRR